MSLNRREFLGCMAGLFRNSVLSNIPYAQKVHEAVSDLTGKETRLVPTEYIINPGSNLAAWFYRGELYLLRYTFRPPPNSPLECDIESAGKVPGCFKTNNGFEMGPEWKTLSEVRLTDAKFDISEFVKKSAPIDWSLSRSVPFGSMIVNIQKRQVAQLYRGELYYVQLTHRSAPNSELECDIKSAGQVGDCRKNPEGAGYQMLPEWQTLAEIQRVHPNFDVVNFLSQSS